MKLSELVKKVHATDQQILITKNGRPAAVLVSPDEYEGWRAYGSRTRWQELNLRRKNKRLR